MSKFTIVIATVIRPTINRLLNCINDSTVLPEQVIISIPKGLVYSIETIYKFKIRIISETSGQVSQRIAGFRYVSEPYCIQMDDDIYFEKEFLASLVSTFSLLPVESAMAPSFYSKGKPLSVLVSPKPLFSRLIYFILDSNINPNYGSITKSGFPVGVNPFFNNKVENSLVEVQWLQGACIIHNTSNLLLDWKYKFPGKAFAEDLIHSQLLKSNGLNLFVKRDLTVETNDIELSLKQRVLDFLKSRYPLYRAISSVPYKKTNLIRYTLFTFVFFLSKIISYLLLKIKILDNFLMLNND